MKFTLGIALSPLDQLTELARTAEECGFASIALPDSLFYSEHVSAAYPYTPDGSRFWNADTPWPDPMVAAGAMGAVTSTIRFYTQVLKLDPRNPVLLARQIGTVAALTGNRFGLGVGLGWSPEESHWCGQPFSDRGARADESIEILKRILGGGMVSFHGKHFSFEKLQMSPAPTEPVPFYVGGHSEPALRRAARIGDGWSSAMIGFDDLRTTITRLAELRAEYGRAHLPFEIQAVCIDRPGLDGFRQQAEIGVTDAIVIPWRRLDASLQEKRDALRRFADRFVGPLASAG
ncbi:TIGR03619 family F420-dependent LLM class oxidoreductase [Actinoplanes sichuanensis]|uniref:TIGR03619 family F420-dependent LLM class oxidoreductase n=1 Tax=Actinoplanes sichuanensis TaxID=512349 RepID=A0ABW4AMK7_9ACTN|nr:TIGR03619 family F420-dependent LLM class oxidoreductase [Actinoplanes sichuanensis]BEL08318.1 TIGR03619 family F420-dependent LLM class oxidoreductase [Actinoplanes sichuanensis]